MHNIDEHSLHSFSMNESDFEDDEESEDLTDQEFKEDFETLQILEKQRVQK